MFGHEYGHDVCRAGLASVRRSLQSFGCTTPSFLAPRQAIRRLTLPASQFSGILEKRTTTARLFEGVPLSALAPTTRGEILARLVRNVDAEMHPSAHIEEAARSTRVNGDRRGTNQTLYDWRRDGMRIECKSAQLKWASTYNLWMVQFSNIKLAYQRVRCEALFDELFLTIYAPCGIYIYRHDLTFGVSSTGKGTAHKGHVINVYGPRGSDAQIALEAILSKLDAQKLCNRIAFVPFTDCRVHAATSAIPILGSTTDAYAGVPLASASPQARGELLEALVRSIDEILHPEARFSDPPSSTRVNGFRRGANQGEFDWSRDLVRVECKSSKLKWESGRQRWFLSFANIKFHLKGAGADAAFDELYLAIYTPRGVYIYRHGLCFGVSTNGLRTATEGCNIQVYSSVGVSEWQTALDIVLAKLTDAGCQRIAVVTW